MPKAAKSSRNGIGQALHNWRIAKNLTLVKAARLLKVSPSTVLRYERGQIQPGDRARYRIETAIAAKAA